MYEIMSNQCCSTKKTQKQEITDKEVNPERN